MADRLFPALLKFWRGLRGRSQLDLALAAGVSARHVAFLESGRAAPSAEMVLRLFATLDAPLRDRNHALRAAGFPPHYPEPPVEELAPPVAAAIERMMEKHEPYPLVVLAADYAIVRANRAAFVVFSTMMVEPPPPDEPLNLLSLVFDPRRLRTSHPEWESLASSMLARFHREVLARPNDARLARKLAEILAYPGVPAAWKKPDFSAATGPTFTIHLARNGLSLRFMSAVTVFSAPDAVTLEELRIESLYPLDAATEQACERLAQQDTDERERALLAKSAIPDTALARPGSRSRRRRATRG